MKNMLWIGLLLGLAFGLALTGCTGTDTAGNVEGDAAVTTTTGTAEEQEEEIPLDQVPLKIKKAAEGAVPGIVFESAEKETEDGVVVYDLEGTANGTAYEVEVTADGKVLEIEEGEDDDDDDDEDDDEDDDD